MLRRDKKAMIHDRQVLFERALQFWKPKDGSTPDNQKAIQIFTLCAEELDDDIAQLYLGACYLLGICVPKDSRKAFEYFEASAKQQNADALNFLGVMTYRYLGKRNTDPAETQAQALRYFLQAAKKNNSDALFNLSNAYRDPLSDLFCECEIDERMEQYALAGKVLSYYADEGDFEACYNLGCMYYWGLLGNSKTNSRKAFDCFRSVAKQENTDCMPNHFLFIDKSHIIPYAHSCEERCLLVARLNLGIMYYYGLGVEKNARQAFTYYQQAALQEVDERHLFIRSLVQYSLAELLKKGEGTSRNPEAANYWFLQTAKYEWDHLFSDPEQWNICWYRGDVSSLQSWKTIRHPIVLDINLSNFRIKLPFTMENSAENRDIVLEDRRLLKSKSDKGDCPSNQTNKSNQIIRTNKKRMTQAAKLAMEAQAKKEQLLQLVEKIQKDMKNAEPTGGCREKSKRELEKIYKNGLALYQESSPMSEKNKQAVQLFKIAAQEGYLPAQIYLSGCYFQGIGVRKNIKAAQKWYTLIAEQGIISVQYKLATSYLHSNDSGIPDIDKCIYWLKRVISNREAIEVIDEQEYRYTVHGRELSSSEIKQEAINLLVSLTCKSIEIEALQHDPPDLRSPEEIESLLNAKINPSALRELGLSYYNQEQFSFSSNDKKALYYFTKAAELGDCEAQFHLACMYYEKESLKDIEKAFYWWSKAAEQGMPEAQFSLGQMYYQGDGVVKNLEKALSWFNKAAAQGVTEAEQYLRNELKDKETLQKSSD